MTKVSERVNETLDESEEPEENMVKSKFLHDTVVRSVLSLTSRLELTTYLVGDACRNLNRVSIAFGNLSEKMSCLPVKVAMMLFLPAKQKSIGKFATATRPHRREKARATLLPA